MAVSERVRRVVIVAASEMMVKRGIRRRLERMLVKNISYALRGYSVKVHSKEARIIVEPLDANELEDLAVKVGMIPGVRWSRIGYMMPRDYELLLQVVEDFVKTQRVSRIAVKVTRSDKSFPKTSIQIANELIEKIKNVTGARVDFKTPEATYWVGVLSDAFLFSWRRFEGVGGLPVGATGRVLALLSGGIDSPVASWMMMKRGCVVDMLHIHALPTPQLALSEKMMDIFNKLRESSPSSRLFLAPYHHFLTYVLPAKEGLELALFRRFMFKLAEKLSKEIRAIAVVAGDSLAQVASQTLEAINAAVYGLELPVLLPLIGLDKEEIIHLSKRLGLYEASIRSYKDCCSIVTRHPIPRPRLIDVMIEWERLGLDNAVAQTLQDLYVFDGDELTAWKDISTGRQRIKQE